MESEANAQNWQSGVGELMKTRLALIGGVGLGAGLMYLLDLDRGRRRRAVARDRLRHAARRAGHTLDVTRRRVLNRARGLVAELRCGYSEEQVADDVLVARIRSEMGHVVRHPHSIDVTAQRGLVVLRGLIGADEVQSLIKRVASVRGVARVENQLQVRDRADSVADS